MGGAVDVTAAKPRFENTAGSNVSAHSQSGTFATATGTDTISGAAAFVVSKLEGHMTGLTTQRTRSASTSGKRPGTRRGGGRMPSRIPTACSICGRRDCEAHRRKDNERPTAWRRGYDADWRQLREQVLADTPLCEHCCPNRIEPATEVHHVLPVRTQPEYRLTRVLPDGRKQLIALCKPCHSKITIGEQHGR